MSDRQSKTSKRAISFDGQIHSVRSKVDKSLSLTVHTPELSASERSAFMELQNEVLDFIVSPKDMKVPELRIERDIDSKSASQRFRAVIFVYWKQSRQEDYPVFDVYYALVMEKLINAYKEKLEG